MLICGHLCMNSIIAWAASQLLLAANEVSAITSDKPWWNTSNSKKGKIRKQKTMLFFILIPMHILTEKCYPTACHCVERCLCNNTAFWRLNGWFGAKRGMWGGSLRPSIWFWNITSKMFKPYIVRRYEPSVIFLLSCESLRFSDLRGWKKFRPNKVICASCWTNDYLVLAVEYPHASFWKGHEAQMDS